MARQRKASKEQKLGALLALIAVPIMTYLAAFTVLIGPLTIFVSWFVKNEDKKSFLKQFINKSGEVNLSLSPEEKQELLNSEKKLKAYNRTREQILKFGKELSMKQNGYFNNSSNRGKELNPKLFMMNQLIENEQIKMIAMEESQNERANTWHQIMQLETSIQYAFFSYIFINIIGFLFYKEFLYFMMGAGLVSIFIITLRMFEYYQETSANENVRKSTVFE